MMMRTVAKLCVASAAFSCMKSVLVCRGRIRAGSDLCGKVRSKAVEVQPLFCRSWGSQHARVCPVCPLSGNRAMKPVKKGKGLWIHLCCAWWHPKMRAANHEAQEPILGLELLSKAERNAKCELCDSNRGATRKCSVKGCGATFHVLCARSAGYIFAVSEPRMTVTCPRHAVGANCEICGSGDRETMMLLCDGCDKGFHLDCLRPLSPLCQREIGFASPVRSEIWHWVKSL